MKLSGQHIELIRKYFLSTDANAQLSIQFSKDTMLPPLFLEQLKQAFNSTDHNNEALASFSSTFAVGDQLQVFKELKQDYYTHLAALYNSGISNPDIEILQKSNNEAFNNEISFQKELRLAFQLNERTELKKTFREQEERSLTDSEDMNLAFTLSERQNLKKQFQAMDERDTQIINKTATVVSFNWKRLAAAAALIAFLLTTTVYLFDKNDKQTDIAFAPLKNIDTKTDINPIEKQTNEWMADIRITAEENKVRVLKESSLGFAGTDEKITIKVSYLNTTITRIDSAISKNSTSGTETILALLKAKRDSLIQFENKYSFNNGNLAIYTHSKTDIQVFKIEHNYYIQIGKEYYYCMKSAELSSLKKLTDKKIISGILDIKHINSK